MLISELGKFSRASSGPFKILIRELGKLISVEQVLVLFWFSKFVHSKIGFMYPFILGQVSC